MVLARGLLLVIAACCVAFNFGCDTLQQDPAANNPPSPLGQGLRIADVQDPTSPKHAANNAIVTVTSTANQWLDTYDETKDGKSVGTLYIQDVGSSAPYSGIGVYSPGFVPSDLRTVSGDVLDFVGPYQELSNIGSANFGSDVLPQLSKPVGTFRYEYQAPAPIVVALADLNDYKKGRQWEGMLVTLEDVWVQPSQIDTSGFRITYPLVPSGNAPTASVTNVAMDNELFALGRNDYATNNTSTHFKSVTGIATWFFSFHLAPRTRADIVCADAANCCQDPQNCAPAQ